MTIQAGKYLGPYEILAAIGAGGMGEVYRARDAKLGRDVALKVLPDAFARDAERMARFQREAKSLASLNHSNIAAIYGLEDSGATHALVMELVEGPTLADRIRSGAIPIEEALPIAKQIAEGLEYAHERGIVHRDLKPSNVKVTSDDAVKILDFGLAKTMVAETALGDATTSPTLSAMATQTGVLLGTAAYMSPEQARGKVVDRRADIWAFGCVLYEMLTGKMVFGGGAVTDTLAAVLRAEPDWSRLPAGTPTRVRVLLQRCLQKDAKQRLQAIGDARISLDEVLSGAPDPTLVGMAQTAVPLWRRALPWALLGGAAITIALLAWAPWHAATLPAPAVVVRFQIPLPEKTTMTTTGTFALSPDGRELAFAAIGPDGVQRLWVRPLDSLEARPLPGSEAPQFPPFFWSPDSKYIAFDAGGKLKKIDISGGPAQTLCEVHGAAVGGSWNRDGVIIFAEVPGVLMRVSSDGGSPSRLTIMDSSQGETTQVLPVFLPDGRHFLYLRIYATPGKGGVYVGSLDAKPEEQGSERLSPSVDSDYTPSFDGSELLFVRDGTLMAQPFDPRRLELSGEALIVAEHVGTFGSLGFFSGSDNGVLVYRNGSQEQHLQLTWFDRQGKAVGTAGEPSDFLSAALSPDGARVAFSQFGTSRNGIWMLDVSRKTSTRFTFDPAVTSPVWSPDGSRVVFSSYTNGYLYQKLTSGAKDEEPLVKSSENKLATSWSRDGRFLLYTATDPKTKGDLWVLPFGGDKKPVAFLRTEFDERDGHFSPDGHWVAYTSNESGRNEIYIRAFSPDSVAAPSDTGGKWLISTDGGTDPRWRGDGKELYYRGTGGRLMAVEIATNPTVRAGIPQVLFVVPPEGGPAQGSRWDVTSDGKRFLIPVGESTSTPFTVVQNWRAGLKK